MQVHPVFLCNAGIGHHKSLRSFALLRRYTLLEDAGGSAADDADAVVDGVEHGAVAERFLSDPDDSHFGGSLFYAAAVADLIGGYGFDLVSAT